MKIGLVQNKAIAGDFSGNLRRVVQGCRACMDAGAELLVASAQALDGAFPGGLTVRSSFLLQAQAALRALAAELNRPLILASYAAAPHTTLPQPRPYLLQQGRVEPLRNHSTVQVGNGTSLYIDIGTELSPPAAPSPASYILHLPTAAWLPEQWLAQRAQVQAEASEHRCDVLLVQSLGHSMGKLLAGGSLAASVSGRGSLTLPLFASAERVWQPRARHSAAAPHPSLLQAACYCLRELLEQSGHAGYAVPVDETRGELLYALAKAAVGARRVTALTYGSAHKPPRISLCVPQAATSLRQRSAQLSDIAEAHDLLLLSTASRSDIALGSNRTPSYHSGNFAPLGDMTDSEIAQLQAELCAKTPRLQLPAYPHTPEQESERELLMQGCSPAEIIARRGGNEYHLHSLMRSIARASASPHPPVLQIHPAIPPQPPYHKLCET